VELHPRYIVSEKGGGDGMEKWKCEICGYVYDPGEGDPDGGIPPDTSFDELPDDWICPVCGAEKELFVIIPSELSVQKETWKNQTIETQGQGESM
jgi:rubredoxin